MKARARRLAGVLLAAAVALDLLTLAAWRLTLFPDEAYYWDWSRHLQGCYVSKGPGIALLLAATTRLLGSSELALRLPAVLLAAAGAWLVFETALALDGPVAALWALAVLLLTPMLAGGRLFITTDAPVMCAWALALYAFTGAAVAEEQGRPGGARYLLGGLAVAAGMLTKWSMGLLLLPLALTAARRGWWRSWLRQGRWWAGLGLAGLALVPPLAWNAAHGWPTAGHLRWQAWQGHGVEFSLPEFVVFQVLLVTPWLLSFILRACRRAVREGDGAHELLAWSCLLVLGLFTLKSLEGKVEPNWPLMAYPGGILVAASAWRADRTWRRRQRWALGLALALGLLFRGLPMAHRVVASGLLRGLDTTHRAAGFEQLGRAVGQVRAAEARRLGIPAERVAVVALRYQAAAEAAYYTPGRPQTSVLPGAERNRFAYDDWATGRPEPGESAVLVVRGVSAAPPEGAERRFAGWRHAGEVPLVIGRSVMDRYTLFVMRGSRLP